eukprot:SM000041S15428  [mRNA]  locus=s41:62167:65563:+ [translate_table: standard]
MGACCRGPGSQLFMGMAGRWTLSWCREANSFSERFAGTEASYDWGFDGGDTAWDVDAAGRVSLLELDDREVIAYVAVARSSWLPTDLAIKAYGAVDRWQLRDWQKLLPESGYRFPATVARDAAGGGRQLYQLDKASSCTEPELPHAMSAAEVLRRDTKSATTMVFDTQASPNVEVCVVASGHTLVKPLLDGLDVGFFILDTGASGLTICPSKADELGMGRYGEVAVTGVEGEVPIAGVVRGASAPVLGICGFDVFRQCVIELKAKDGVMMMFAQDNYKSLLTEVLPWQSMHFISNVPHVKVTIQAGEDMSENGAGSLRREVLLLLDTGAGGVDVIFHHRAVKQLNLLNGGAAASSRGRIKGMGGASAGLTVQVGQLKELCVGGKVFKNARALLSLSEKGGLDLSEYTAGLLCGDILRDSLAVIDYPRRRFALATPADESLAASSGLTLQPLPDGTKTSFSNSYHSIDH